MQKTRRKGKSGLGFYPLGKPRGFLRPLITRENIQNQK